MTTTNGRNVSVMRVLLAAVLVGAIGCGEGSAMIAEDDAGTGTGGAGGMAGSQDGPGGSAAVAGTGGTGGTPQATGGTIGSEFTRADHDMCMQWPECPPDVFSILIDTGRVFPQQCKTAFDGGRISCTACLRRSTCEQFTGRCLARFLPTSNPFGRYLSNVGVAECRSFLDTNPSVVPGGWALCTGDTATDTVNASGIVETGLNVATVCKD